MKRYTSCATHIGVPPCPLHTPSVPARLGLAGWAENSQYWEKRRCRTISNIPPVAASPLGRRGGASEMVLARIGCGYDDADGFLVEALEAAVALEVLKVAAQGAFLEELPGLLPRDEAIGEQALDALAAHRPALAFGEGLPQEGEVGERVHCIHAGFLQLVPEQIEVEPRFQMVHACVEEALTMQPHPQPDSAEARDGWQLVTGEIQLRLVRHQVHVSKHNDSRNGLLGDLRAPAGFRAGVVALALGETQLE